MVNEIGPALLAMRELVVVVVATLFFALGNAILIIPLGLVPSWLALASTGFDVLLLGVAVALWDAFDEGQALRADMLRRTGLFDETFFFSGEAAGPVRDAMRFLRRAAEKTKKGCWDRIWL